MTTSDMFGDTELFNHPVTAEALGATRPWVRFIGILGYVVAALMGVGAIVVFLTGEAGGVLVGITWAATAIVYFFIARFLLAYAHSIGTYLASGRVSDLNAALLAQKSFWRLAGFLTIAGIVIGVLWGIVLAALLASVPLS